MSALAKTRPYFTAEEYLAHEERAEHRSEFYRGEIFAMAGASANHNRVVRNLVTSLSNALSKGRCEAFASDLRLYVKREQLYTYPDVMVICGALQFAPGRLDTVTNPVLIFEVLSPTTEAYDRGKKFEFYRTIETLHDYVLVDQDRMHVEHFQRQGQFWQLASFDLAEDVLTLPSIEAAIPLAAMYERVEWEIV